MPKTVFYNFILVHLLVCSPFSLRFESGFSEKRVLPSQHKCNAFHFQNLLGFQKGRVLFFKCVDRTTWFWFISMLEPIGDWKQLFRRHLSPEVAWNPLGTSFRGGAARRRDRPTKFWKYSQLKQRHLVVELYNAIYGKNEGSDESLLFLFVMGICMMNLNFC